MSMTDLTTEHAPAARRPSSARRISPAARHRMAVWSIRLGIVIVAAATWEVFGRVSGGVFVPPLSATLEAVVALAGNGTLWTPLWASNLALVVGFPISCVLGLAIGFVLGRHRWSDRAFTHYMDLAIVVPMIALVPIVIVALGLTTTARTAIVVLFALPSIALSARASVRVIARPLVEMSSSFGASRRQTWTTVILPGAAAPLFTGLRIGLSRAIGGMIVIELTLIPAGLGGLLVNYRSQFAAANLYATTVVILLESLVLIGLFHSAENWVIRRMRGGAR